MQRTSTVELFSVPFLTFSFLFLSFYALSIGFFFYSFVRNLDVNFMCVSISFGVDLIFDLHIL